MIKRHPCRERKCRKCVKNVVKPTQEDSVASISFQLLTILLENFPKLLIKRYSEITPEGKCLVELIFENRTKMDLDISLHNFREEFNEENSLTQVYY